MVNPVPGFPVTTAFGKRGSSWSCDENSAGKGIHTGVDIAAPEGTKVVAARGGIVRHVHFGSSFGDHQIVVRRTDGTKDFYAHMRSRVADGTVVDAGDKIGSVGHEGNVFPKGPAGAHLHFERHTSHGSWSCGIVTNPKASINADGGDGASTLGIASTGGVGVGAGKVFLSKLRFGQRDSDSVKRLQAALNAHAPDGAEKVPVTGNYLAKTDAAVRADQALHLPPADAEGKSFIGTGQAEHLFANSQHTLVNDLVKDGPPLAFSGDYVDGAVLPPDEVAEILGITEAALLDVPSERLPFTESDDGRRYPIESLVALLS